MSSLNTTAPEKETANNTLTFVIGFGILILFLVMGIAASAFLCLTLKKDSYLWESEINRQLQEQSNVIGETFKERDKSIGDDKINGQECSQV